MNVATPRPPTSLPITSWGVTRSLATKPLSPVRGILQTSSPRYSKLGCLFVDPNASEKAKEHAREILEAEGEQEGAHEHSPSASSHDQHLKRVLAGYKAALHSTFSSLLPPLPSATRDLFLFLTSLL